MIQRTTGRRPAFPAVCEMQALVYVVDDDAAMRSALVLLIESFGFAARGFATGIQCVEAAINMTPACIVTDLNMPGMDGRALIQGLHDRNIKLPIIVISGEDDSVVTDNVFARLRKPFKEIELRESLDRALSPAQPISAAESTPAAVDGVIDAAVQRSIAS